MTVTRSPGKAGRSAAAASRTISTRLCGTSRPSTAIVGLEASGRIGGDTSLPLWITSIVAGATPRAISSCRVDSETAAWVVRRYSRVESRDSIHQPRRAWRGEKFMLHCSRCT